MHKEAFILTGNEFDKAKSGKSQAASDAVEWYLTKLEYRELEVANYDDPRFNQWRGLNDDNKQAWSSDDNPDYTPIFIDLVDDFNQRQEFAVMDIIDETRPEDRISGYNIDEVERNIVKGANSIPFIHLKIISNHPDVITEEDINDYFIIYFNL